MRSSRAQFKYALKYAKRIEETAKADALAKDLVGQKFDEFWKSVNKINQSSQLHTTTNDGITGEANIAEHWRTHFHSILNTNICDQTLKSSILGTLDDIQHDARMIQLGLRYDGQLNPMAEPIPHEVRPLVRTHVYHPYHAADRQAETDS